MGYSLPMTSRRIRILILALITTALGWNSVHGLYTAHYADQLCDAIHAEDEIQVKVLLDQGIDPLWANSYGTTSLRVAGQHPDLDVLHLVQEALDAK